MERGPLAWGQRQEGQAFSKQEDGLLDRFIVKTMKLWSVWEDRSLWLGVGDRMQHREYTNATELYPSKWLVF